MDANQIIQAVGSLGFPIVACFAMFYFLQKEQESHKAEMQKVTEALNGNTEVLTELKTIISMLTGRKTSNADSSNKNL